MHLLKPICFIFIITSMTLHSSYHPTIWKNSNITQELCTSSVIAIQPMQEVLEKKGKTVCFDNNVALITLENGLKAVFKPGNRVENDFADAEAEVAAYKASVFLGFPDVPSTIMRTINGEYGSLQLYVDTHIDVLKDDTFKLSSYISPQQQEEYKLFCFILGQWDTGAHNILIYHDGKKQYAIAIDNAAIKNRQHVKYGSLPFVRIWYNEQLTNLEPQKDTDEFPFDDPQKIVNPTEADLYTHFNSYIPLSICKGLARKKILTYALYNNGLWIQHHAHNETFEKSFIATCSKETLEKLKQLDIQTIRSFFSHAESDCFNESFFNDIINRRDQVLAFFAQ